MNSFSCPTALNEQQVITLSHGSGGKHTSHLIQQIFLPAFANDQLSILHDGAVLEFPPHHIVFTTDSYVVQPIFFPGGDIGKLAVTGTLNDLAMCGANPAYLSCSFIIEEGFLQSDLKRIVASMKTEADAHSVRIVTGDTKVIERQSGGNIFINTAGLGLRLTDTPITPLQIKPGDQILISGDIGRHGVAIMAQREGLSFTSPLVSDCASVVPIVHALINNHIPIHCLRDLTRGGLATALVELSESAHMNFSLSEEAIPISQPVNGACEILGLDPMYVANEGRFIAFVPEHHALSALEIMQQFSDGEQASIIGHVNESALSPKAILKNAFGSSRFLYKLVGDQLPRIC